MSAAVPFVSRLLLYFWLASDTIMRMKHRHLTDLRPLSSAAIDDIIDRGNREDWAFLRDRSQKDSLVMARIRRVCAPHLSDVLDQKYHLWSLYAGEAIA